MTEQEVENSWLRIFIELGAKKDFDISDTLFIDGDRCLAIAYRTENLSAVWCFEDETIQSLRPQRQAIADPEPSE